MICAERSAEQMRPEGLVVREVATDAEDDLVVTEVLETVLCFAGLDGRVLVRMSKEWSGARVLALLFA